MTVAIEISNSAPMLGHNMNKYFVFFSFNLWHGPWM